MTAIKDILQLNLEEDIKSVIDLEDRSENEIQSEIESYIITDGLGEHLSKFINKFTSNIKETGVWLSGFYGSGKSYFGKMLGYLIENPMINGTSARDRFIPRLAGVKNQNIIENDIRKLDAIKSRVVFLDIAKQNTDNGLAFTLFINFIKSLGFRDDVYGYMEFELFVEGKYDEFKKKAKELLGNDWDEIKKSGRKVAKAMRRIHLEMDYTEKEYEDTKAVYDNNIANFSANTFKDELEKYLNKFPDEVIVFIFDEASEAISQGKFKLLDLEGISESLSSISKKVWTIAIAQEKLNDVINNSNIDKANLTRVTDRFKTKIHLESTEVDVIIRNRLLLKKDTAYSELVNYYHNNEGLISDATNLKSTFPTKTKDSDMFATYYPFHKYQFDLLQNFLFSSNALVATQIAARGMIITTFDVLRKAVAERELHKLTTAYDLCTEAQTSPPSELVIKYDNATKTLSNANLSVDGEKLLKTIHFINEAERVMPTVENITKMYIDEMSTYYDVKPDIEKGLGLLVDAKILLLSNNNYKITSDLERKLLEEMKDISIDLYVKKRELVSYLKNISLFKQVANVTDGTVSYNFRIATESDDDIITSKNRNLRLTVYSLFNITDNSIDDFIDSKRLETQYKKDEITLVPDNGKFNAISELIEEIRRFSLMEEKYGHDDDQKIRQIINEFSTIKESKEKELLQKIEEAYGNGTLIYMYDTTLLNTLTFRTEVNNIQTKLIKNVYTKRLSNQLSEQAGLKLLSETNGEKLHRLLPAAEFKLFDTKGNFIGDHLKVVEEITAKITSSYVSGKNLEEELAMAPWGYSYGTISSVLAALFRAGKLFVRINDTTYSTYTDRQSHEVFKSGAKFKNAQFKAVTKSLTAAQKNEVIVTLLDLKYEKHTEKKIDWNVSDFEAADAIKILADNMITTLNTLKSTQNDFDKMFGKALAAKDVLQHFTAKTTEENYIDKVVRFIQEKKDFIGAVKTITKTQKFVSKNLDKLKGFRRFVTDIKLELQKAGVHDQTIADNTELFWEALKSDVVERFADIQKYAQAIKDEYYKLMMAKVQIMSQFYRELKEEVEAALKDLNDNYPAELNRTVASSLRGIYDYCEKRIVDNISLEFQVKCQKTGYSLSDILNYIELVSKKESELELCKNSFIDKEAEKHDVDKPKQPKRMKLNLTKKIMKVSEYRKILASQIQEMAGLPDDDEVEVEM